MGNHHGHQPQDFSTSGLLLEANTGKRDKVNKSLAHAAGVAHHAADKAERISDKLPVHVLFEEEYDGGEEEDGEWAAATTMVHITVFEAWDHSRVSIKGTQPIEVKVAPKTEAFLIGDGRLPQHKLRSGHARWFMFDVVTCRQPTTDEGIFIGVTPNGPQHAQAGGRVWRWGFAGHKWYSVQLKKVQHVVHERELEHECEFDTRHLCAGDRVGVLITHKTMALFVNGSCVARAHVSIHHQLFPCLHVLGNVKKLSLPQGWATAPPPPVVQTWMWNHVTSLATHLVQNVAKVHHHHHKDPTIVHATTQGVPLRQINGQACVSCSKPLLFTDVYPDEYSDKMYLCEGCNMSKSGPRWFCKHCQRDVCPTCLPMPGEDAEYGETSAREEASPDDILDDEVEEIFKLDVRTATKERAKAREARPALARCDWCGIRFTPGAARPTRQGAKGRACPTCFRMDIATLLSKKENPPVADPTRDHCQPDRPLGQAAPAGAGSRDRPPIVPRRPSTSGSEQPVASPADETAATQAPAEWEMAAKLFGAPVEDRKLVNSNQVPEMPSFLRAGSALTTIPDGRDDDEPTDFHVKHHPEHHLHHHAAHSSCSAVDFFSDCAGGLEAQPRRQEEQLESKPGVLHAKPVQRPAQSGACSAVDLFSDCAGEEVTVAGQPDGPVLARPPGRQVVASV